MNRRRFLATGVSGTLATLAGCISLGLSSDSSTTIDKIYIGNAQSEPNRVDLLVERNDEVVYWKSYKIAGMGKTDQGYRAMYHAVIDSAEWLGTDGHFVVFARLHDQEVSTVGPKSVETMDTETQPQAIDTRTTDSQEFLTGSTESHRRTNNPNVKRWGRLDLATVSYDCATVRIRIESSSDYVSIHAGVGCETGTTSETATK